MTKIFDDDLGFGFGTSAIHAGQRPDPLSGAIMTPMLEKYFAAAEDKQQILSVLTGAHLIRRLGKPEEVAKLAVFLACDESSFITGAAYVIDGGTLAWRGTHAS